jgi:UDP-N-acetylmuramate dehydrogenase
MNADCGFEYRKSIFNTTQKNRFIVLSVTYALKVNGMPRIVYGELVNRIAGRKPTLRNTREIVCKIRKDKGMLVRQGGLDAQSAGSFFKNPVVTNKMFGEMRKIARSRGQNDMPGYPADRDRVKIPAAWLIEKTGFEKGFIKGNAGLSTKHTLALTNRGGATAVEILDLKEEIQRRVKEDFGVDLVPEPDLIGFTKTD